MSGRRDDGVAAVELALFLGLMMLVAVFLFPVGKALYDKMLLGRAAGDALRFATSAPNTPAYGSSGRRPSVGDVQAEAVRAYNAAGGSGLGTADVAVTAASAPGQTVKIRISKSEDMGPFGSLLSLMHVTHSDRITVTVDASGREE